MATATRLEGYLQNMHIYVVFSQFLICVDVR